jgi:hypothetical protein
MQQNEQEDNAEHDAVRASESDETAAERAVVARMLANPRRVRRA